jgi:DNA-binding winged helix-turn-helix (wHTH) protein
MAPDADGPSYVISLDMWHTVYELRRGGTRIPLRPKVFQVLVYLIEQRDRVVSREEVLAQVWPHQCNRVWPAS